MEKHEFKSGYIDTAGLRLFVACDVCGREYDDPLHNHVEISEGMRLETRGMLDELNEKYSDHDCHGGPESGCATCEEFRTEAEQMLAKLKEITG